MEERQLQWVACYNVRDLGGLPTKAGGTTRMRSVIRADNLSRLTAAGWEALTKSDIRTVIDLRDPRELQKDVDPFQPGGPRFGQLVYRNAPLISEAEWTAIRDPEVLRQGYVVTLDLSKENIVAVLETIAAAPDGGVVIHCHAGKERTGVIAMLLLALAGVPNDVIAEDYIASDRYLEPFYAQLAANELDTEKRAQIMRWNSSAPSDALVPLAYLERVGGIDTYLAEAGVSQAVIASVRGRLAPSEDPA